MRRWVERRRLVLLAAAVMFAVVFAVRMTSSDAAQALALVYVVPIALVALELGFAAGVAAALLAVGLVAVWAAGTGADLGSVGLLTRGAAYLAVGGLAGRFGDRMRDGQERQHRLLGSGLALASLESADDLGATLVREAEQVSGARIQVDLLDRPSLKGDDARRDDGELTVPIEAHGVRYGTLRVNGGRSLTEEDRATLRIVALQAAVAAENGRLLEGERERAIVRAELQDARMRLEERGGQVRAALDRLEAERGRLADELHEEAAQTLAAVLMGLAGLERELEPVRAAPRLGELRSNVDDTLQLLRSLAVSLRPSALAFGLRVALERLAEDARERGIERMTVAIEDDQPTGPDLETMVYRAVEESLEAVGPARSVTVATQADGTAIVIRILGAQTEIAPDRLTLLKARIELAGGALDADGRDLCAHIPLRATREAETPQDAALPVHDAKRVPDVAAWGPSSADRRAAAG